MPDRKQPARQLTHQSEAIPTRGANRSRRRSWRSKHSGKTSPDVPSRTLAAIASAYWLQCELSPFGGKG